MFIRVASGDSSKLMLLEACQLAIWGSLVMQQRSQGLMTTQQRNGRQRKELLLLLATGEAHCEQ